MLWEVDLTRVYHVHTKTFHLATPFLCSGPKPKKSEKWRLTVKQAFSQNIAKLSNSITSIFVIRFGEIFSVLLCEFYSIYLAINIFSPEYPLNYSLK